MLELKYTLVVKYKYPHARNVHYSRNQKKKKKYILVVSTGDVQPPTPPQHTH